MRTDQEYCTLVKETRCLEHLEHLETHESQDIYKKCVELIENFWKIDEDVESDQMVQDSNQKMEISDSSDNKKEEAKMDDN